MKLVKQRMRCILLKQGVTYFLAATVPPTTTLIKFNKQISVTVFIKT